METTEPSLSGGHLAAKPSPDDDEAGVDRLSALPNSVLLHVLAGLGDAAAAGRTSVLSSRWRRLWALLPELRFVPLSPDPGHIASALAAHEAELRHLDVTTHDAAPEPVAAWLRVAARRLSGSLVFTNRAPGTDADGDEGRRSAFDERHRRRAAAARDDYVDVDDAQGRGAFELPCLDRATSVSLDLGHLGLTMPRAGAFARLTEFSLINARLPGGALGDAVSSRRCPCLERLTVRDARGVEDLTIRSDSLRHMELTRVLDLRQLDVVALALEHLRVLACFYQLGKMKHLEAVCLDLFLVYGNWPNKGCLELLRCLNNIETLGLTLVYLPKQTVCPPGCICDEEQDWKFEELLLNHLQEVEITELRGSEHEVIFVKHLLSWATELKKMTIFFNPLVTESMARKSYQILRRFSRIEICMQFYIGKGTTMVPYVPKD